MFFVVYPCPQNCFNNEITAIYITICLYINFLLCKATATKCRKPVV